MKFKHYLISTLAASTAVALSACGGTGNAGPMASANYGQVESISLQKVALPPLVNLPTESFPIAPLYQFARNIGYYAESAGTGFAQLYAYESANAANTQSIYNFDVNNFASRLFLANTVSAYAIKYQTPGQNADTMPAQIVRTASGMILVPNTNNIRGVVVYFHPTTLGKNQVPSCLVNSINQPEYCKQPANETTGFGYFAVLSSIYASRGFVVIAPDYVGQGNDWNNVHPYVAYPENNVLSAFYMFPAMRQILAERGIANSQALPLFITGYSEGGGYALKASQMAQNNVANLISNNNLQLKITSPQEGAYSLKDQMDFAFANLSDGVLNCANNTDPSFKCGESDAMESNGVTKNPAVSKMNNWNISSSMYAAQAKPPLTSYVLTAAMYYSFNNMSTAYNFAMNNQFWSNINMGGGVIATLYDLYSGVMGHQYTGGAIGTAIIANTMSIKSTTNGEYYNQPESLPNFRLYKVPVFGTVPAPLPYSPSGYGANNQGTIFINQGVNTSPDFEQILVQGSTYNWQTKSPINFIHMVYDSAVTVLNSHQAYTCMKTGTNFTGSGDLVGTGGQCATAASGSLIESTIIPNYQITNNLAQLATWYDSQNPPYSGPNPLAHSKFWTSADDLVAQANSLKVGIPFDHGNMFVLGNIIALCTFENQIADGTNSGICPQEFNQPD